MNIRSALTALCAILHFSTVAAEPDAAADELPRVPPASPEQALEMFQSRAGIRLELVAAEPLVADPIALCFDEDSRLFVVEMRDYSERRQDRLGRIRMLEDSDGDGRMDRSTVFADDLPWPTALAWYNGGLFVGTTPDILYLKDTDGDGKADERTVVFTGFGSGVQRLNVQQLFNSFTWTLDNRIHGASGGNSGTIRSPVHPDRPAIALGSSDFSFDPRTLEFRRESGGGQYGMSFDNAGRKFVCNNSSHIRQVMYDHHFVQPDMQYPLPPPLLDIPVDGANAPVYRISPDEPWRVLRTKWRVEGLVGGPIEGGGRASGYFTSATGITIYRGTALGEDFAGDAFIADVGSNLVHRKKLRPDGVPYKAERADDEQTSEFLASRDLWFRPVAFANAPDGGLYILDMYREVVEHPWSLPPNIKKHLDLNSGNDRGRIYRVVGPAFKQPALPRLSRASTAELIALLSHPNGWHRDTALRLLHERHGAAAPGNDSRREQEKAIALLRETLRSPSAYGQLHALAVLSGIGSAPAGAISADDLSTTLTSRFAEVREWAARLLPRAWSSETAILFPKLAEDPSPRVRAQFAWSLGSMSVNNKKALLEALATRAIDPWESHAVRAAASRDPALRSEFPEAFPALKSGAPVASPSVADPVISRADAIAKYSPAISMKGDLARGKEIYLERCASCHRYDGQGTIVGPDLESVQNAGRELVLVNIIDPNREVQPRYTSLDIITTDNEMVTGVLANDAPNGLTLLQASGGEIFVPRARIKEIRGSSRSLMPEGLEEGLTPEELAGLLDYLSVR